MPRKKKKGPSNANILYQGGGEGPFLREGTLGKKGRKKKRSIGLEKNCERRKVTFREEGSPERDFQQRKPRTGKKRTDHRRWPVNGKLKKNKVVLQESQTSGSRDQERDQNGGGTEHTGKKN